MFLIKLFGINHFRWIKLNTLGWGYFLVNKQSSVFWKMHELNVGITGTCNATH